MYLREKYTRILIPSFLFVIAANIFFVIISVFQGGIFRGWLSKKSKGGIRFFGSGI